MVTQKMNIMYTIQFVVNVVVLFLMIQIINNMNNLEREMKKDIAEKKKPILPEGASKRELLETEKKPGIKYDLSYLKQDSQHVVGPLQDDESVFLYGLVKTIRPKTVLEFGFYKGDSSKTFLRALDADAKMWSFDVKLWDENAESLKDPRFKLHLKSQTEFIAEDIENAKIELVFMDAGHKMDMQTIAFQKILPHLSSNAVVLVHDTGLHRPDGRNGQTCICDFPSLCGVAHAEGERSFINWILEEYPEWQLVNIHSFELYRHGLTIMQKKYKFSTQPVADTLCKYF